MVATDGSAFDDLLNRITVQETSFFRHPDQFATLVEDLLPSIRPPVRFWSAGCANGQEAFSLAMILEERGIDGSVVATDLSMAALRRTAAARYSRRELSGLSPQRVARHLRSAGAGWEIASSVRNRVTVLRHNLLEPLPPDVRSCQVVFCRNVLIYISHVQARRFLDRVADSVTPVALFLGSAEAIWTVTDRFEAVRVGDVFVHRPRPPRSLAGSVASRPEADGGGTAPASGGRSPAHRGPTGGVRVQRSGRPAAEAGSRSLRSVRLPAAEPGAPVVGSGAVGSGAVGSGPAGEAAVHAGIGQRALTRGDSRSAIVSFRKWTYLAPGDALAQVHLGLALEAAGDHGSARQAYGTARRLLLDSDPGPLERAIKGFARGELLRFLDDKQRELA